MLSLGDLFVSGLLALNGAAVLSEDRFLIKIGWGYDQTRNEPASVKKQIVSLLHAPLSVLRLDVARLVHSSLASFGEYSGCIGWHFLGNDSGNFEN